MRRWMLLLSVGLLAGPLWAARNHPHWRTPPGSGLPAACRVPNVFGPDPGELWQAEVASHGELALVGDFDGDGKDDLLVLAQDGEGSGWLHFSDGRRFGPAIPAGRRLCNARELPVVGDFNGDGADDLAAFVRDTRPAPEAGVVYVALSNRRGFETRAPWSDRFCTGRETPAVGDFDGDGRDDVICFAKDERTGNGAGNVEVALNLGDRFGPATKWHNYFCVGAEQPVIGDFDGDHRDDIATLIGSSTSGPARGTVFVALSQGNSFSESRVWSQAVGRNNEFMLGGDFNGDGRTDLVGFRRGQPNPALRENDPAGDVTTWLSAGRPPQLNHRFGPAVRRHEFFCIDRETPLVGDFNGDGKDDLATLVRNSNPGQPGAAYVALATFGQSAEWRLKINRLKFVRANEASDEPYLLTLGYRARFGARDSLRTFITPWHANWISRPVIGREYLVPDTMGVVEFGSTSLPTASDILAGKQPEVFGATIVAMEEDGSSTQTIYNIQRAARNRLEQHLRTSIEGGTPNMFGEYALLTEMHEFPARLYENSTSAGDPDDLVGERYFLWLAADPDAQGIFPDPCAVAGTTFERRAERGWLREQRWTVDRTPLICGSPQSTFGCYHLGGELTRR